MKYETLAKRSASHTLVFGDPGAGKSTLMSNLADAGFHLWWFSIDNGHGVIDKLSEVGRQNVDVFVLPSTAEFPVGWSTIYKAMSGASIQICDNHGQVDCSGCKVAKGSFSEFCGNDMGAKDIMVIDPLTKVAQAALHTIGLRESVRDPKKKPKEEDDIYKMSEPDWGTHWGMMDKLLTRIEQARWHICASAHVLEGVNEDNTKKLVPMVGTRNFSVKCAGYFDNVVYQSILNKQHKAGSATTYMMNVITKSRKDVTIENLETQSLVPFFDGTIGEVVKEKAGSEAAKQVLGNDVKSLLAGIKK